jgi:hypothetical protein
LGVYFVFSAYRLTNFSVLLSNTSPTIGSNLALPYSLCAQYDGSVEAGDSSIVMCASSAVFYRFVIIQSWFTNDVLCLTEVAVCAG